MVAKDYFSTLGVPRSFTMDSERLQARFYELSRELHPDRFATRSPGERADALARMSEVNQAYRVLADPQMRRRYLLELEGVSASKKGGVTPFASRWFDLQDEGGDVRTFLAELNAHLAALEQQAARLEAEYDRNPSAAVLGSLADCLEERNTLLALRRDVEKGQ